ncbi:cell wall protein Pga30p [[Candida] railenensis]|uniref:Cell wall protein Pga30p n=1 Tax=[Candida] railenensis TaxID=45579 RepID=A0A9P0QR49_9ASCO|nr:cell wall protein Pga30p [[Candida] railenensis]
MKFTTFALSAATFSSALAAVYDVQLFVDSSDASINGNGLSSIHEGAGINYFVLGTGAENFQYDDQTGVLTSTDTTANQIVYSVGVLGQYLSNGVTGSSKATFEGDKLSLGGNTTFYAAKNTGDPYNYSDRSYIVLVSDAEGSIPFNIKAVKTGSPSSSTPAPSSTGYTNDTTTTLTYTAGHTTVVTITSCAETVTDCPARHTPQVVTTVIPVTLTTTYCPASTTPTYVPYTSKTVAAESTTKATSAPATTHPAVTTAANGAAKVGSIAGAGLVAFAAYLL